MWHFAQAFELSQTDLSHCGGKGVCAFRPQRGPSIEDPADGPQV